MVIIASVVTYFASSSYGTNLATYITPYDNILTTDVRMAYNTITSYTSNTTRGIFYGPTSPFDASVCPIGAYLLVSGPPFWTCFDTSLHVALHTFDTTHHEFVITTNVFLSRQLFSNTTTSHLSTNTYNGPN